MANHLIAWIRNNPPAPVVLVLVAAVFALSANLYGALHGITIVVPHLLYLPVVLCAFLYPKRGVIFTIVLSALYFVQTAVILPSDGAVLISAASRCAILVIIALVVSYLSGNLRERERIVRSSKEEWERTFDAIPDLIAIIGTDYRILRVNRALAEKLGKAPEQVTGIHCYEVLHRLNNPLPLCPHARLLEDGQEHSVEIHEEIFGGDFLVSTSPFYTADGSLAGSVHIARDITAQIQNQQKIRQLAAIVQYTTDAVISLDLKGNILSWNEGAVAIYGYQEHEVIGRNISLIVPEDRSEEIAGLLDRIGKGERIEHYETVRVLKDGRRIQVSLTESPILNAAGRITGVSVIAKDVTERRRAEDAIHQANRKLNILSSITRHDILNTITGLYAYVDMTREICTGREQRELIGREIEAIQTLQRQIEFTRYYQDIGVQEPKWYTIGETFGTAISQLPLNGIAVGISTGGLQVYADPLIEKVFYNLVENSIRHGEHVTQIQIRAEPSGNGYSVIYEDNGAGIPADSKPKLFRRGFGKHTGLGLFLSREILAITGITVTENGEPGKGARFEIAVPAGGYRFTG